LSCAPGEPIRSVHFPVSAVIAALVESASGRSVEVGAVGSEGYVETDAALEAAIARRSAVCRFPGAVLQIEAGAFRELLQTQRQVLEAASCECYALIRDAR
jgi:CRP-like cAMP-binding protein